MGAATYNMLTYIVLGMFAYSLSEKNTCWGFTVFRTKNNHVVTVFGLSFSVLHKWPSMFVYFAHRNERTFRDDGTEWLYDSLLVKKRVRYFTVFRTKNNHVVTVFGLSFSVLHNGQACLRISLIETNVHFMMTVRNGYMKYMTT